MDMLDLEMVADSALEVISYFYLDCVGAIINLAVPRLCTAALSLGQQIDDLLHGLHM